MIKRGNRKRRRTRLISLILTLFMLISAVQTPVFAGSDVIYLPEDDIGEDILSGGAFYLSSSTAEIAENAGASYLFKVARGGEDLPDASVRLNILDITAKYGEDYKIRIYENSLFGETVKNAGKNNSLLEEIVENADDITEVNYSDGVVSGEEIDAESAGEMYAEDLETFSSYLGESLNEAAGESDESGTSEGEPAGESDESGTSEGEPAGESDESGTSEGEPAGESDESGTSEGEPAGESDESGTSAEDSAAEATEVKKASSLKAAKELATGIESNRIPMDGGDTLDRYTRETLSQLSEELESAYLILNFAEGETEKYIEIIPKDNSDGDGDRLFMINLFAESENAEISPVSGITVTITDDEVQEPAEVEFSQSEYDPQDGYIKATLVRSGAVNQMVSVKMSTEDVTAAKERDYSPVDTTVAFPYGITERTVNIPVRSDYVDTQAEFRMLLSDAANCNIGAIDTASGVISSDSESFSQVQEADGDAASQEEDGSSSDVSLMADAGVDSVITGTQIDLTKAYSSGAHDDGYSRANGSEWELYAKSTWNDVSSWAYWSEGTHYDYSGLQIEWTKESGKPCYTDTYVQMYNLDSDSSDRWDTIWSTGEERWGKRTNNMYFSVDRFQEFKIKLTREGGWTGKSPTLKIHSVKPILRPFEISLKGADPLYFLNEDGKYVKNTSISGMTTANQTTLQNATNTGTGTVVKFSGDTFTVTTNSDYAYISGLKIVDNDTGASKLIKKGLAVGTKTASVQLTNDFIKQNLDYITFTKNGSQGRKGAFSIQAVLDYYDTEVNIHSDYRGEIYHNLSPEEPAEEESSQISGYYYIKNKNSGLYLQSSKADAQGNVVQGKMTDSGSCVWYFQTDAKGWTTLENGSGYYLDANVNLFQLLFGAIKSSKTAGKSGGSAQNFKIIKQSDGSYIFRSGVSESRALSVLGAWEGAAASLRTIGSQADASSSWMLEKADIVTEGTYRIKNLNSGLYLRPDGAGHYNVKQSSAQDYLNWTVIRQSDGWYTIKNESGYMLDVSGAYPDDGTRLITYASNESDAQKFMLKKQEDGSYAILTKTSSKKSGLDVQGASKASGAAVQQYSYAGNSNQKWIFEQVDESATGAVKTSTYHKGDCLRFVQDIFSDYSSSYTASRIRFVTKDTSSGKTVDNKRAFDAGTNYCTFRNEYAVIDVYPDFVKRENRILVRVLTSEIGKFDTTKGIFNSSSVVNEEYTEYTAVNSNSFSSGIYYELSARAAEDGYVPVWQPIHKETRYSQETFYFESTDEIEENIVYLSCEKADAQKYVLTGNAYYSDVDLLSGTEGAAWMPASGVYVLIGPERYGISTENGSFNTIGMYGINGYSVVYKTVASGLTEYKSAVLSNKKTTQFGDSGTEVRAYDVNIGTIRASASDKSVPYVEAVVATNLEDVDSGYVYINDNITAFVVTVNNDQAAYTDTDGTERTESVTGVDLLVYDGQTNELKKTISGASCISSGGGRSTWRLSSTFTKNNASEYAASDKLYVRLTTDRVIGNGKSVDENGNEVENEALKSTIYTPVNTGYTFVEENTQKPVTQDIDVDTNMDFIKLPLIGDMNATFNISKVSFSISELPNGGQRLSIGFIPKTEEQSEQEDTADDGVKYGVKDIKKAFSGIKDFGQSANDMSSLGMSSWGLYPIFGVYLDFGIKNVYYTEMTSKKLVFIGGGLYLGATGNFRLVQYFVVGWVPFYMGVNGELSIYTQVGISAMNEDAVTSDTILKEENSFGDNLYPEWCLQANGLVAAYVGAGLCGTLGVRGGIQFDANYIYNPTIKYRYPTYDENGLILSANIKVWIDAVLFSIPIPVVTLFEERYGYYDDIQESAGSLFSAEEDQDGESKIVMRPRTSGSSEWMGDDGVQLMSTFEEAGSTVLLENGYDRADPQLLDIGNGRILLTFLADDPKRSDENRTALMYSIYEDGEWSEPLTVQDDGTADFEPNLCDAGDKVLISWTSRSEDAKNTNETDYLRSLDVYAVTLDKNSLKLGTIEQLTDDEYYDSAPVGLYDDKSGDMMVYYLKSEVTDGDFELSVSPAKNESVIVYMLYDAERGQWARNYYYDNEIDDKDAEEILISQWGGQRFLSSPIDDFDMTDPIIMDFNAISYNGIGLYAYTIDADNNMNTDADRELFVQAYDFENHKTYVPIRITDDNLSDSMPQLIRNGEHTYLFWMENNADIRYIDVSDLIKNGVKEDGTIDPEYELDYGVVFFIQSEGADVNPTFGSYKALVDGDDNLFITWLQPVTNEDGSSNQEIYASARIQDKDGTSWSDGVRLTYSGAFNDEVALITDENGNLLTVGNQYKMDLSSEDYAVSDIKLVATNFRTAGSLEITEAAYSEETPQPEEEIDVYLNIKNSGLKPAKGYTIDVYEKINGKIGEEPLCTLTSEENITPSSSEKLSFKWKMPESYEGIEDLALYLTVNETGTEEVSELTAESIAIKPVYEISEYKVTERNEGFFVDYTVTNTGNADYSAADIQTSDRVVVGFNDIYHTGEEVEPYLEAPIGDLAVGEIKEYTMELSIPDEQFEFGYTNAYMEIQDVEGNTLSNSKAFTIALEYPYNIVINGDESLTEITLKDGEELKLSAVYSPDDFYVNGAVNYTVDDTSVAYVDGDTLKGAAEGTTTLTAMIVPYGGSKTIRITVDGEADTPSGPSGSGGGSATKPDPEPDPEPEPEPDPDQTPGQGAGDSAFTDVEETDWFYDSVKYVTEKGYFKGISEGVFAPQLKLTRGMFVTLIGRIEGVVEKTADTPYTDVSGSSYYASHIAWATENGLVDGYGDGRFGPDDELTREQMAKLLSNYIVYRLELDTDDVSDAMPDYADIDEISGWAMEYVEFVSSIGLMQGRTDGTFAPENMTTRAEAATVIERLDKKILEYQAEKEQQQEEVQEEGNE